MSLRIKAIVGAAVAAALSAGVVASAAVAEQKPIEFGEIDDPELRTAIELRESPEWWESFEEALLEGKLPTDPVASYRPKFAVRDDDEILPVFLDPASMQSTETGLTLVHDDSDGGYNLWEARIVIPNVETFGNTFDEIESMDCEVYSGAKGRLVNGIGYSVNFKKLSAKFTYLEDGKAVNKYDFVDGYGTLPALNYEYSGSGKLVEKTFCFYMFRGDERAPLYDVALVHVVSENYAKSAEYAALPYGDLIDCYTYVEPSEPSEAAPERN